tara:strand:+ start:36 stop:209 length:174 start_codon:yes stop_codon:yes gene_type:complete
MFFGFCRINIPNIDYLDLGYKEIKKGLVIFKNNLTYKAPLVGSRSNRFWNDLKKFKE